MFGNLFGKKSPSSDPAPPPMDAPMPMPTEEEMKLHQGEHHNRDESTPLIRHGSRKTEPKSASKPKTYTQLSTISDVSNKGKGSFEDDDDKSLSNYSIGAESVNSLRSLATVSLENFRGGLQIPFYDESGSKEKILSGLGSLFILGTLLGIVMPKNIYLDGKWYPYYRWVSSVIGYNYFVTWSICFYPQVLLNYRRKSTQGLSPDFAILNFMGWSFYSAYLCSMYFNDQIKKMYSERFSNESSTVQSNDVAFSVHAMILSFIYLVQIFYYRQGGVSAFHLKPTTWILVLGMGLPSAIVPLLIRFGYLPYSKWLDYFYTLSFFKICCTLTKYSKQVTLNFKRKSTSGWNIWYNFLECSGGTLSMLQIVLDSLDMEDLTGITGNMAKFALGLATIFFDGIFFTQHYILYPHKEEDDVSKEGGIPVLIGAHVRTNSRFQLPEEVVNKHSFDE